MIVLAIVACVFLLVRIGVTMSNLLGRQWLKEASPEVMPLVSILIPARNEEKNIGMLLQSILEQDYPSIEVIVYDDESTDATAPIVQGYTRHDDRIKLIQGKYLPDIWLGKNYACHQMALQARGDYFLFLDADVRIGKSLIRNGLAHLISERLKLFSIFPQQIMASWGERFTVPAMNYILLSLLPLSMIKNDRRASLSAANGQFMLFDASTYRQHWFHGLVKNRMVEDILIMRIMKKMGYRVHTLLSHGQIKCRMYDGLQHAVTGFSRNIIEYFGGHILAMIMFAIFTVFGFIFVLVSFPLWALIAYLALNMVMSAMISIMSRQPVFMNLILMPVQKIIFIWIGYVAIKNRLTGRWYWKDRKI